MSIQLGTCPRDGTLVYVMHLAGLTVAVDPVPLDQAGQLAALVAGKTVCALVTDAESKPVKLIVADAHYLAEERRTPIGRPLVGEHKCGVHAADIKLIPKAVAAPPKEPAPSALPDSGGASPATLAPSKPWGEQRAVVPCENCGLDIGASEERVMVELGATVVWARHTTC